MEVMKFDPFNFLVLFTLWIEWFPADEKKMLPG